MRCAYVDTTLVENDVAAYYTEETDSKFAAYNNKLNNMFDAGYPYATRLYSATPVYNCHSYAWHSQKTSENKYWINNPANYYVNGSYSEAQNRR